MDSQSGFLSTKTVSTVLSVFIVDPAVHNVCYQKTYLMAGIKVASVDHITKTAFTVCLTEAPDVHVANTEFTVWSESGSGCPHFLLWLQLPVVQK